jgi:hypothetical protein
MKRTFRLLFFAAIFCVCQKAPPIGFVKEDVTIEVLDKRVRVTGVYYFENTTQVGKRIRIYYPFPVDSLHQFPDAISIVHPFESDSAGICFWLSLRPNRIDSCVIVYEQRISRHSFRYITTTTKMWARPIKEARFTIIAPDTLPINVNHRISRFEKRGGYHVYSIRATDYYPKEDLIVEW